MASLRLWFYGRYVGEGRWFGKGCRLLVFCLLGLLGVGNAFFLGSFDREEFVGLLSTSWFFGSANFFGFSLGLLRHFFGIFTFFCECCGRFVAVGVL